MRTRHPRLLRALLIACGVAGPWLGLGLGTLGLAACATQRDHLNRGQRYYDENEYEKALALWRVLEADADSLSELDQARYAYLRGMTDYRLNYRPHARHWLAIAKAIDKKHPGGLDPDWKRRADEALEDLNKDVYGVERFDDSDSTSIEHDRGAANEGSGASGEGSSSASGSVGSGSVSGSGSLGFGASTGPKACRTDSDCPGEQACVSKKCVQP